jgi:uncharacterized protein (DUF1810 family)
MTHDLNRFLDAQAPQWDTVRAELERGRKLSHWMWYFFPQLRGLGRSSNAEFYGIHTLAEAQAYLQHDTLGARLRICTTLMNSHRRKSAEAILGIVDALKFRSSMTLFAQASGGEQVFIDALNHFYGGVQDPQTLKLLQTP